jgi:hypothetical protein
MDRTFCGKGNFINTNPLDMYLSNGLPSPSRTFLSNLTCGPKLTYKFKNTIRHSAPGSDDEEQAHACLELVRRQVDWFRNERNQVIAEMDQQGVRCPAMSLRRRHAFYQRRYLEKYAQCEDLRSSVASCISGSEQETQWQLWDMLKGCCGSMRGERIGCMTRSLSVLPR